MRTATLPEETELKVILKQMLFSVCGEAYQRTIHCTIMYSEQLIKYNIENTDISYIFSYSSCSFTVQAEVFHRIFLFYNFQYLADGNILLSTKCSTIFCHCFLQVTLEV